MLQLYEIHVYSNFRIFCEQMRICLLTSCYCIILCKNLVVNLLMKFLEILANFINKVKVSAKKGCLNYF